MPTTPTIRQSHQRVPWCTPSVTVAGIPSPCHSCWHSFPVFQLKSECSKSRPEPISSVATAVISGSHAIQLTAVMHHPLLH